MAAHNLPLGSIVTVCKIPLICSFSMSLRLQSIMLQSLLIMSFGISPICCLLCSFLGMHYADNLYL